MKRIISFVLSVLMILIGNVALATENTISFPYGLELGMSIDEATLITGFSYIELDASVQKENQKDGIYGTHCLRGSANVAGYNVSVVCHTDALGNICQIRYTFESASKEQYEAVEAALAKYGTTPYQGGKPITHGIRAEKETSSLWNSETVILDNFDRIIPYISGTVLIEHTYYVSITSMPKGSRVLTYETEGHMLSYSYIDVKLNANETSEADF